MRRARYAWERRAGTLGYGWGVVELIGVRGGLSCGVSERELMLVEHDMAGYDNFASGAVEAPIALVVW